MSPRGLPGQLPDGETLLWSGHPDWRVLARAALRVRLLVGYFAVLVVWCGMSAGSARAAAEAAGLGAIPVLLALGYAWAVSRTAVYTITDKRVALHIGLALPVTLNLPHGRIVSADLRAGGDGSGDLSLTLGDRDRFAYAVLWPHARPWRFSPAQPTLRGLADVAVPAQILAHCLAGNAGVTSPALPVPAVPAFPGLPSRATVAA